MWDVPQTYDQVYTGNYKFWGGTSALNYTSPLLHTVLLSDLAPATECVLAFALTLFLAQGVCKSLTPC